MINVYRITSIVTSEVYVGVTTKELSDRMARHVRDSRVKPNRKISKAIQAHGKDNFTIELLEVVLSIEEASEREKHWIEVHESCASGLNCNRGGIGKFG